MIIAKKDTHTDDEKLQLVRNLWEFILQAVTIPTWLQQSLKKNA